MTGRHRRPSWLADMWHVLVVATADFWVGGLLLFWGAVRPIRPKVEETRR